MWQSSQQCLVCAVLQVCHMCVDRQWQQAVAAGEGGGRGVPDVALPLLLW